MASRQRQTFFASASRKLESGQKRTFNFQPIFSPIGQEKTAEVIEQCKKKKVGDEYRERSGEQRRAKRKNRGTIILFGNVHFYQ